MTLRRVLLQLAIVRCQDHGWQILVPTHEPCRAWECRRCLKEMRS